MNHKLKFYIDAFLEVARFYLNSMISFQATAEKCEELWDINNGVTMLKKSHKAYHNMWGKDNGYLRK
jgi:hypothetical protein